MSPNEPRIALNRAAETAHPRQAEHAVDALERLRRRVLVVTTLGYIGCFAVWTIFAIIGVEIQRQYGLSDTEFGLLVGAPFLSGSLMHVVLGLWADRHGGRRLFLAVMIVAAVATWFVADATTFPTILVAGLGTGIAGGCSAVGLSYITRWYPKERHGTALGILGTGNAGAAITKLAAPWVMLAYGWQGVARLWALLLLCAATVFWLGSAEDPKQAARRAAGQPVALLASCEFPVPSGATSVHGPRPLASRIDDGPGASRASLICKPEKLARRRPTARPAGTRNY